MGKFTGYLICTDCDGTLTYEPGKVSEENAQAIRYFQREGGLFTLATGRFPDHAKLFEKQIKINAPMISLNGAILYDEEKETVLKKWSMKKQDCLELLSYVNEKWQNVEIYWINGINKNGEFGSFAFPAKEQSRSKHNLVKFLERLDEPPLKMLLMQHEDLTPLVQKDLKEKFGDKFIFDLSWKEGIEINRADGGKGAAVKYLKEHLEQEIHTTVGIGDYENDITLLKCADIGYAVENAIPAVRAVADRVTVKNTENAIAAIINELGQF